ncbi:MAG: Rieske 2Fe-2S domain-containing protein [Bacteroidales bacterium]|nr:Rieske 2Fe-2S domain-containing protein [Bacteroidales bacterium]
MKKIFSILLCSVISVMLYNGCETNRGEIIPYVRVDIYKNIYADLGTLGPMQSMLIQGGYNGIVLFRDDMDNFYAYDRTCTLWPEHNAAVVSDTVFEGVFVCPECHSKYLLSNDGQVISGPANYPLVRYRTSVSYDVLHIYN